MVLFEYDINYLILTIFRFSIIDIASESSEFDSCDDEFTDRNYEPMEIISSEGDSIENYKTGARENAKKRKKRANENRREQRVLIQTATSSNYGKTFFSLTHSSFILKTTCFLMCFYGSIHLF